MSSIPLLRHRSRPAGLLDDWLLAWVAQGLFFGIASTALLVLKAAVLDQFMGPELATRTVLVRLAILGIDVALLAAIYRHPVFRRLQGTVPFALATAAACLLVAAVDGGLSSLILGWLMPGRPSIMEAYPLLAAIHRMLLCVVWSLGYHALQQRSIARRTAQRAIQADLDLRSSELQRLGQQIEPHFLFNALSAVLACRHDPDAIEAVTTALADYLRFCLSRHGGPEPLAHELDAIELLLSVHEARFAGSLTCRVTSSPAARRVLVPPLLLGPLVDNALKYGSPTSGSARSVVVEARIRGDRLVVEVTNSGCLTEPSASRTGTGLANLRRRLELAGLEHRLTLEPHEGFVTARVELPVGSCDPPRSAVETKAPRSLTDA